MGKVDPEAWEKTIVTAPSTRSVAVPAKVATVPALLAASRLRDFGAVIIAGGTVSTTLITKHETVEVSVAFVALGGLLCAAGLLLGRAWRPIP